MPCDTQQLNQMQMIGLDLDMVAKTLEQLGIRVEKIDRKERYVRGVGATYQQKNGELEYNAKQQGSRLRGLRPEQAERAFKREFVWQVILDKTKDRGWEVHTKKDGKKFLRKRTGYGGGKKSEAGLSDNTGTFQGFIWNH